MVNINIEIDRLNQAIKRISRFNEAKRQRVKDVVNESALNVQTGAKQRCPVDTGRLRSSIAMEPFNNGFAMQVGSKVKYAASIEFGTGPFEIRPKKKKALYWPGAPHPVKKVNHPGIKAQPFLFPAWETEKPQFIKALKKALGEDE